MEADEKLFDLKTIVKNYKLTQNFLISKWPVILIFSLLFAIAGFTYATFKRYNYIGNLSFVLSTESKGGNLSGLASQFGIDLGGGSTNDVFSGDNIIRLFTSRKMIRKALFLTPPESNVNLLNIYIKDQELDKKWAKRKRLQNSLKFQNDTITTPIQDSLINEVYLAILKNSLTISRSDKKLSVYDVATNSTNELFSCYLTKFLVKETAQYYIDTKMSLAKLNLNMLQKEADSIRHLLGNSIYSTASEVDRTFNLNPALQVNRSSIQKGQVNTTVLGTAYSEVVKNLELAKINLQKETPLFQIIDSPELPLKAVKVSKILAAIAGFILGFFLICIFLLIRKKLDIQLSS